VPVTVTQLARVLQTVLTTTADAAAQATGFVRRRRQLTGARFVQALVFGWLDNPQASLDDLALSAATVGARVRPQALDQRFSRQAADCLQTVLQAAVRQVVAAQPQAIPLLARFAGVYLLDATTISLPACLAALWPGCGGCNATAGQAALKVQVRWEWSTGALDGLALQAGRAADGAAPLATASLPAGALRLADLGYFDLEVLQAYDRQRVFWLTRRHSGTAVYVAGQRVRDLAAWLAAQGGPRVDRPVQIGRRQRLPCRLVAERVPEAVAEQRRQRLLREARDKGRAVRPERLALCAWTVYLTNVPAGLLSAAEILVLGRVRWQIELLFKLWKSHGAIDTSRSGKPWRVLCEVYAKLLAMVVQHWVLLVSGAVAVGRSLRKAARKVRQHALHLASVVTNLRQLATVLRLLQRCLERGPRLNKRKRQPATFQLLLQPPPEPVQEPRVAA
jgi:hypothetical protein